MMGADKLWAIFAPRKSAVKCTGPNPREIWCVSPGLDTHQQRAAVNEDLIEAADPHQCLALSIEVFQGPPRRLPGGLDPTLNRGATGACLCPQDQRQQDKDLIEAQAHGRGRNGELPWLGRGELNGLSQPVPESRILVAEIVVLLVRFGARRPAGVLGRDGGLDLVGLVGDGLSAAVDGFGLMSDVAVHAGQARRGVGDPGRDGYLEHGWAS